MKMKMKKFSVLISLFSMALVITSCSIGGDDDVAGSGDYEMADASGSAKNGPGSGDADGENTNAGVVTAGEWSDLNNWQFWSKLMEGQDYADKSDYWKFYTNNRVAVSVSDLSGRALAGIPVKLLRQDGNDKTAVWSAVTDNHGLAECFVGLFQKESADEGQLLVSVDGQLMDGHPILCPWDSVGQPPVNHYQVAVSSPAEEQADIAFIVDATGSMGDEIDFLKSDLVDIINKVGALRPGMKMRTSALFYRDEGDEYLTRHSDFTEKLSKTVDFVKNQSASGGGDYPEAVHAAMEHMLQDLGWNNSARTRLAFMLLDAPAHHNSDVIMSLQKYVRLCAENGIRLIPVAASGVDKDTEFMLRFFAIATGGTYVFLTNDSGVGLDHIAASVGDYEVEQLNELLIRLISYYTE